MWSFPDCGSLIENQASKKRRSWKLASCPTTLALPKSIMWLFSWTWQEIMESWSNSPFVFCNPDSQWSFSLTVVYKTAVGATDFVHYARLWPVNLFLCFRSREQTVHSSQWFEDDLDFVASLRFDQSSQKCSAHRVVPRSHWTVDRRGVLTAIFRSY